MKLHHLRDFLAIAQARSIRAAARQLGLSQPALTRSLRELEHELDAPLFERHARGIVLTPIGAAFYRRTHAAMQDIRRAREEVAWLRGRQDGAVAVGLSGAVWLALVPAVFAAFRQAYPTVRLHMMEGFFPLLESRLADGTLDFYIGPRPQSLDAKRYRLSPPLFTSERVIVGRKEHPLLHARQLEELANAQWILTGARDLDQEFTDVFTHHGLPAPLALVKADSMMGVATLLSMTDALALLPEQWVASPLFSDRVAVIPIAGCIDSVDIVSITRAGLPLMPAAMHLAALFERAAGHV